MAESLRDKVNKLAAETVKLATSKYNKNKRFTFVEVTKIVANAILIYRTGLAKLIKSLPQGMKNEEM